MVGGEGRDGMGMEEGEDMGGGGGGPVGRLYEDDMMGEVGGDGMTG